MNTQKLTWIHIDISSLLTHQVHHKSDDRQTQADRASPPDDRRPKEVILRLIVTPATHTKTQMHERPIEGLRGQDIFLIGVRDKCIVGRHHGDVEMPEVAKEGRAIVSSFASRHYETYVSGVYVKMRDGTHSGG